MRITRLGVVAAFVSILLCIRPGLAQQDAKFKSSSLDGATGLFKTWDAETLGHGEVSFSLGVNDYNRDPGQLSITTFPVGGALGAFGRLEIFGAWDAQKRIEAENIQTYRVLPGEAPRPATTRLGVVSFTNEALFIDVPRSTGRGDLRGGVKLNLLSERRRNPFGLSAVVFGELSTNGSFTALNRGLSSDTLEGGVGALFSKRAGNVGSFHVNALVNWVRSPRKVFGESGFADVGHEYIYRAGAAFPANGRFQLITEVDAKVHAGDRTPDLNPTDPVDLILGFRSYPKQWLSLGAGYRATLNHIKEDPANLVFKSGTHGFVVQLAFALQRE